MPPLAHSELGASSAHRWMACPASVRMSRIASQLEKKHGKEARSSYNANEGTCAHDVCEQLLTEKATVNDLRGKAVQVHKDTIIIDDEMLESAGIYVATIKGMCGQRALDVEQRFSLDWLYRGMFGTCDCTCLDVESKTLWIFDFKYGKGKAVFADNNPQLLYYALGVLGPINPGIEKVIMTIVQPRNSQVGIDTWECSAEYLYDWAFNTLLPAAKRTEDEESAFCPGEEQCRWCKAVPVCPALYNKSLEMIQDFFPNVSVKEDDSQTPALIKEVVLPPAKELTPDQIQKILDVASVLTSYFDAVKEDAFERMKHGVEVPGYKLVRGRSSRTWENEKEAAELLSEALGSERIYEKKLISPAKAEKLVDKSSLSPYISISEGKLTIAPLSDKRKAVEISSNVEEFFSEPSN